MLLAPDANAALTEQGDFFGLTFQKGGGGASNDDETKVGAMVGVAVTELGKVNDGGTVGDLTVTTTKPGMTVAGLGGTWVWAGAMNVDFIVVKAASYFAVFDYRNVTDKNMGCWSTEFTSADCSGVVAGTITMDGGWELPNNHDDEDPVTVITPFDVGELAILNALGTGTPHNISHITAYKCTNAADCGGGPGGEFDVPIPAAAWLLGSAVIGLSVMSRRRKRVS